MGDFFTSLFGSKPKVPSLPKLDFNAEQQNTITGNQQALPKAQELASATNTFNQSELDRIYEQALPGYNRIKSNLGEQYSALTAGQIPQDVQDAVLRNAAVRAYGGGFAGSGLQRNLSARDLGLTSLDLIGRGQDASQRWLQTAAAPRFDITSMFLTPAQRIPMVVNERDTQFNRNYLAAQIKAMPSPAARGIHDGVVNLLMGFGNYWGGNYQTTPTSQWGGGGNQAPASNIGGQYQPQSQYGGVMSGAGGSFNRTYGGQPSDYSAAAYGGGGESAGSSIGGSMGGMIGSMGSMGGFF